MDPKRDDSDESVFNGTYGPSADGGQPLFDLFLRANFKLTSAPVHLFPYNMNVLFPVRMERTLSRGCGGIFGGDGLDHAGVVIMRQISATDPFLARSAMTWERGHPAGICLHLQPVRIFHPGQVLHYVRLTPKRARCPRSQVLYASRVDHLSEVPAIRIYRLRIPRAISK